MATIALAAAGAVVGGALLPAGATVLGATISGAAIGSQIGALAGSWVDQSLFAPSGQSRTFRGPRLQSLHVTASTEGAPIPRLYGRCRLGGQVIWATDIEEEVTTTTQPVRRGKGRARSGGAPAAVTTTVEYTYFANIAVALCEGPIAGIGRVWADGQELDLAGVTWRLHTGAEDQEPDALIVSREGADSAPAYRAIAYVVFEHLALAGFGNRIPQLSFEVHRAVDELHGQVRGVVIIPGSGEFVYATEPVTRLGEGGARVYENVHTRQGGTDWQVAIDQLEATLPNAKSASLVVSWFGTDLRAGHCQVKPGVDIQGKSNAPTAWSVAGLQREEAHTVSVRDGRAAYGGTPSDDSVIAAIRDLRARGFSVTFTPFIMMDIGVGNSLPDPYSGASSQPVYPWRGRITINPAPGRSGTVDKTAAAADQIAAFAGTAAPSDFVISGDTVAYNGPAEWSFRRQVLHYASLAQAAGGVDAFVIASELRGLTQARSASGFYPFVSVLAALAADVKSILGPSTKVTYAADWSEYFGHQPSDGSGDVYFYLDALWASPSIDAIGIDLYWPLADWRDGGAHADALAGARSIYDLDYLKSNIAGGEYFDWYYANAEARASQARSPITDGYGKPWIFRAKDLRSWWMNQHFNRPGGVEAATPTAWIPQSKPVWLMEIGCPAVDKGANQPNVFIDPKSVESALPYFSDGRRDDLMQRRYLQALIEAFDPEHSRAVPGLNPASNVFAGHMIDVSRIHAYAWDARPYPAFPNDTDTWGDGDNWHLGHWLNGRLSSAPLAEVVAAVLDDHGFDMHDTSRLDGVVGGYAIDRIMAAREALQPLELAYFFDSIESDGNIVFRHRGEGGPAIILGEGDLVDRAQSSSPLTLTRGQESELPTAAKLTYVNAANDYRQAIAEARRQTVGSGRVAQADVAVAMSPEQAAVIAETWLYESWTAREKAQLTLPQSRMALEPGDTILLDREGHQRTFRIIEIGERGAREVSALAIDEQIYRPTIARSRSARLQTPPAAGLPLVDFLDLPYLRGDESEEAGYVAATQTPWPGGVAFYSSPEATGFKLSAIATAPATTGVLIDAFDTGPCGRIDFASSIRVKLDRGELASVSRIAMLGGANLAAIRSESGAWEIVQFQTATLIAPSTYDLSVLLRGQGGTETAMAGHGSGERFVLLDGAVTPIELSAAEVGLSLTWRFGPSDRDLGEESFASSAHRFAGLARRPLSPVHVRGVRQGSNLVVSWVRRTRLGGDSWEAVEVPLAEESERYEIDILDGATAVRTLTSSVPEITYSAAQQLADFGALQGAVGVRIHQIGATWGRGSPAFAVV